MTGKEQRSTEYRAWVRTAWAAGVFSLIVLALLGANFVRKTLLDPLRAERVLLMREGLRLSPKDEALKEEIRELDRSIRQDELRRKSVTSRGSLLLAAGLIVFLSAAKMAKNYRKELPMPGKLSVEPGGQARSSAFARRGVAVLGAIIAVACFAWAASTGPADKDAGPVVPSYPSIEELSRNWPRFRGLGGAGVSAYDNVPSSWGGASGEGVLWKTKVPLTSQNSPVVWGDRVFLTGATKSSREVYCFDANSGALLWQRSLENVPGAKPEPPEVMDETGYAAATAAADGRRVYAIFANGDLASFDFEGRQLWAKNLGLPENAYGHSSSLATYRNLLIVLLDQGTDGDGKSKLMALSGATGATVWETKRPLGATWGSPIVIRTDSGDQIVASASPLVMGYDAATGAELWRAACLGGEIGPSPVYAGGTVFVTNAYSKLAAIKTDGRGDVTGTHVMWAKQDFSLPDICSPVANGELVFLLATDGTLSCFDAKNGEKLWEHTFETSFYASPSLVGDRLYLISEKGMAVMCRAARTFEELGRAELGEKVYASPAFMDGRIYIRGVEHLYCIGEKQPSP